MHSLTNRCTGRVCALLRRASEAQVVRCRGLSWWWLVVREKEGRREK